MYDLSSLHQYKSGKSYWSSSSINIELLMLLDMQRYQYSNHCQITKVKHTNAHQSKQRFTNTIKDLTIIDHYPED